SCRGAAPLRLRRRARGRGWPSGRRGRHRRPGEASVREPGRRSRRRRRDLRRRGQGDRVPHRPRRPRTDQHGAPGGLWRDEAGETRSWWPPYAGGEAAYFLAVNRGKRSVALDLKHPEGLALALDLSAAADVVIENFRPGAAARLGLDAAAIHARNSRVVYCSITGFGRREPHDRPGYDFIVQAESGLMAITGEPDAPPTKIGVALVDVLTGLNAAVAILAALRRRDLGGTGERIEISLLDSALAALVNVAQNALVMGEEPPRYGNAHASIVPYQPFAASDGWIAVAAANDSLFARLCEALARPELATDKRFATNA